MQIADWIDRRVRVHRIVHTGHHQVRLTDIGNLLAVEGHLVLVKVEGNCDDSDGSYQPVDPPESIWFNTLASHFDGLELEETPPVDQG